MAFCAVFVVGAVLMAVMLVLAVLARDAIAVAQAVMFLATALAGAVSAWCEVRRG
jgi:hypothetical protein